jgi:hypothetical protein
VEKKLRLRWDGQCASCSGALAGGTEAWWDSEAKSATCVPCHDGPPPIETGVAGASAAAEYEKRSRRESRRKEAVVAKDAAWREQVKESHPVLGRVATALTPKPVIGPESQSTRAWKVGAEGELGVARTLAACDSVIALHDRRVPGTKGNIDHLAIGPGGVYIIDAKRYEGKVERRDVGSFFRPDERLYVNNRDRTKVVRGMGWQVEAVRSAMDSGGYGELPLRAVLCFVDSEWPLLFAKPIHLHGVTILWPKALQELVRSGDVLDAAGVDRVARDLATALPVK